MLLETMCAHPAGRPHQLVTPEKWRLTYFSGPLAAWFNAYDTVGLEAVFSLEA